MINNCQVLKSQNFVHGSKQRYETQITESNF